MEISTAIKMQSISGPLLVGIILNPMLSLIWPVLEFHTKKVCIFMLGFFYPTNIYKTPLYYIYIIYNLYKLDLMLKSALHIIPG